jgi:hypothetical protein
VHQELNLCLENFTLHLYRLVVIRLKILSFLVVQTAQADNNNNFHKKRKIDRLLKRGNMIMNRSRMGTPMWTDISPASNCKWALEEKMVSGL